MFEREAERIAAELKATPNGALSPVVNLGSSTEAFRTETQPWIERILFEPLRARAVEVVHVDVKRAPGVDLTADILTDSGFAALQGLRPQTVLLCNILEHVREPGLMVARALEILRPGGRLIISVPRSYPHHRDPIDTMFRPTPEEIAALAPEAKMAHGEIVATGYYWDDLRRRPWIILRHIVRAPFPFLSWSKWKRSMKKPYWLFRPYRVTIAVLEKPA